MFKPYSVIIVFLIVFAGCAGSSQTAETPALEHTRTGTATTTQPSHPPNLDQRLYGVVTADNRSDYASKAGLAYDNGSVRVVVELTPGASLPEGYDVRVELRQGQLVQGYVAVDQLVGLSRHENVSAVRPPKEPQPT